MQLRAMHRRFGHESVLSKLDLEQIEMLLRDIFRGHGLDAQPAEKTRQPHLMRA